VSSLDQRRRANPSSILYWSDLRDDPKLRRCSPAAKGLWAVHMLPAAAESAEYGVVILDDLPSLQKDLGGLFARELGEAADATQALVDELVSKGAASIDAAGRVYCRRMVREDKLRQQRSAAGKLGAAAKWQTDGEAHGEPYGERHGESYGECDGKTAKDGEASNASAPAINGHALANGAWQTDGEGAGKPMPSSLSSHSSRPLSSLSHEENLVPCGTRDDDAGLLAVFNAWNEAASRVGRWPAVRKLEADRRKTLRTRIKSIGGIGAFLEVLAKAEASKFCREDMSGFGFDWFLKAGNFRKVAEGNYDDKRQKAEPAGHVDAVLEVAEMYRRQAGLPAGGIEP
jgi:hypothetical protein